MTSSHFCKDPNATTEEEEDDDDDDEDPEEDEEQLITATFSSRPNQTSNNNPVIQTTGNNNLSSNSQFSPLNEMLDTRPEVRARCVATSNPVLTSIDSTDSGPTLTPTAHQTECFFSDNHHHSGTGSDTGADSVNVRKTKSLLQPFAGCMCSAGSVQSSLSSASTTASTQPLVANHHRRTRQQHHVNDAGRHLPSNLTCDHNSTPVGNNNLNAPSNVSIFPTSVSATASPPFSSSTKQFCFDGLSSLPATTSASFATRFQPPNHAHHHHVHHPNGVPSNHILKLNLDQLNAVGTFANQSLIGESAPSGSDSCEAQTVKRNSANLNNLHQVSLPTQSNMAAGSESTHSRPLSLYEKRYLLAVERGDLAGVRRMIELAAQMQKTDGGAQFNINCTDPLGRSALLMAIDNENLDMIELLVECGVEMRDSLLHAINEEFVEAVELLLDYEEALQRNRALAEQVANDQQEQPNSNSSSNDSTDYRFDCRPTLLPPSSSKSVAPTNDLDVNNNVLDSPYLIANDSGNNTSKPLLHQVNPSNNNNSYHLQSIQPPNNGINSSSSTVQHMYSWEGFERETFTSDVTPLILAAHKNNYEIIKLLLDRGISPLPCPHDARCGCRECTAALQSDCLRYSRSRINAYRALASPSLIALSSRDPIHTAFELSWQLRRLSFLEPEFKCEYVELRKQCQAFATALLDHTRTHHELEVLLNYEPEPSVYQLRPVGARHSDAGRMHLARLKMAIRYKQKKFCAHANVQQLLASIWYEGLPGFRRRNIVVQILEILFIGFLFPLFALAYIVAPYSKFGQIIKKPFIKFICHSASYMTFLILLALASQRIETNAFDIFGVSSSSKTITKRGAPPTLIELMVLAWVIGLIWSEIKQLWELGLFDYMSDMWNILDFITNSLYVATITLRVIAYLQVQKEISMHTGTASLPREDWDAFDPILLAEGLFAAANIFSSLKLVYIFSVNPHLGPLQISLGRMVVDILKFFSVYILVLFAFACGMNQLLWYYADMEKQVCIGNTTIITNLTNLRPTAGTFINTSNNNNNRRFKFKSLKSANEACLTWRRFANLFESSQTLFWASFGLIDLENFELTGIQSYTRFWGLLMFGSYCVINVVVLLNLLIAMMNHSYQSISEQADTEWKFARTKLWMSYFEDGATVPPPFNVIPTPKSLFYLFKWLIRKFCSQTKFAKNEALKTIRRKARQASERDHRYQNVIRLLVRRYITNEQRIAERKRGVTEDDCNEIKQDISALRFELIELMGRRTNSGNNNGNGNNNGGNRNSVTMIGTSSNGSSLATASCCGNNGSLNGPGLNGTNNLTSGCPNGIHSVAVHGVSNPQYELNDSMARCACVDSFSADCANSRNTLCGCTASLAHHPTLPAAQLCSGKRDRQKERRLMKGFDFNCLYLDSATSVDEDCAMLLHGLSTGVRQQLLASNPLLIGSTGALGPVKNKSPNRNRFIRLARGIASKRNRATTSSLLSTATANGSSVANVSNSLNAVSLGNNKWKQLIEATRSKVKPFSRSSESVNSDLNLQTSSGGVAKNSVKKDSNCSGSGSMQQLDANVKRSLFARKITSLLKEEHHFSTEEGDCQLKETSSSFSPSNSSELAFKSDLPPTLDSNHNKIHKNEWI